MPDTKFTMNAFLLVAIILSAIFFFFTVKMVDMSNRSAYNEYYPIEGTDLAVRYSNLVPNGVYRGGKVSGVLCLETTVLVYQIAALLPLPFMLFASGYRALFMTRGPLALLFDGGMSALPRWETLLLSLAYRRTESELAVCFAALILALAWGLASRWLLRSRRTALPARWVLAGLTAADLVLRLLPMSFNGAFGTGMAVFGFAVRLACLALVLLDLRAHRRESAGPA